MRKLWKVCEAKKIFTFTLLFIPWNPWITFILILFLPFEWCEKILNGKRGRTWTEERNNIYRMKENTKFILDELILFFCVFFSKILGWNFFGSFSDSIFDIFKSLKEISIKFNSFPSMILYINSTAQLKSNNEIKLNEKRAKRCENLCGKSSSSHERLSHML